MAGFARVVKATTGLLNRTQTPPSRFSWGIVPVGPTSAMAKDLSFASDPVVSREASRAGTRGGVRAAGELGRARGGAGGENEQQGGRKAGPENPFHRCLRQSTNCIPIANLLSATGTGGASRARGG